jgi:hypothetical protein
MCWRSAAYRPNPTSAGRVELETLNSWVPAKTIGDYCHPTADDLSRRVATFETRLNRNTYAITDRLWVKDQLGPEKKNYASQGRRGLAIHTLSV